VAFESRREDKTHGAASHNWDSGRHV